MRQDIDELLTTSKRLVEEMQFLMERARQIGERHLEIVASIQRKKP